MNNFVRWFGITVFVAQSPLGKGGDCFFEDIQLIYESPKDIRKGI